MFEKDVHSKLNNCTKIEGKSDIILIVKRLIITKNNWIHFLLLVRILHFTSVR